MDWIAAILIPCALAAIIVIAFFRYRSRVTVSLKGPAGFGVFLEGTNERPSPAREAEAPEAAPRLPPGDSTDPEGPG